MGGLYYPDNLNRIAIGSKDDVSLALTGVELESTYSTTESPVEPTKIIDCAGFSKINLDVSYTMGSGESSNSIELKIEGSPDRTNWYRIANDSTSGATSTLTAREFTFVGADAATATISIFLDIAYKHLRVSCKETGVAANKGNVFVEYTLSGK